MPAVDDATIMQRVRAGLNFTEVSLRLGISVHRVSRVAKAHGYDARQRIRLNARLLKQRRAAERQRIAFAKAREAAEEARLDALYGKCPVPKRVMKIPEWVRRVGLAEDYRDHTFEFGEFAAARHCRALKREAERGASPLDQGRRPTSPCGSDLGGRA